MGQNQRKIQCLHFGVSSQWHELRMENGWLDSSSAEEDWRPFLVYEPSTGEHVMHFVYTKKANTTEKCYLIII